MTDPPRSLGGRRGGSPGGVRAARPSTYHQGARGPRRRPSTGEATPRDEQIVRRIEAACGRLHLPALRWQATTRPAAARHATPRLRWWRYEEAANAGPCHPYVRVRGTGVGMSFSFCRFRTERPWQYQTRSAARVSHDRRARKRGSFKELSDGHSLPLVGATASASTCLNRDGVCLETVSLAPFTVVEARRQPRMPEHRQCRAPISPRELSGTRRHGLDAQPDTGGSTNVEGVAGPVREEAIGLQPHRHVAVRLQSRRRRCRRARY